MSKEVLGMCTQLTLHKERGRSPVRNLPSTNLFIELPLPSLHELYPGSGKDKDLGTSDARWRLHSTSPATITATSSSQTKITLCLPVILLDFTYADVLSINLAFPPKLSLKSTYSMRLTLLIILPSLKHFLGESLGKCMGICVWD